MKKKDDRDIGGEKLVLFQDINFFLHRHLELAFNLGRSEGAGPKRRFADCLWVVISQITNVVSLRVMPRSRLSRLLPWFTVITRFVAALIFILIRGLNHFFHQNCCWVFSVIKKRLLKMRFMRFKTAAWFGLIKFFFLARLKILWGHFVINPSYLMNS